MQSDPTTRFTPRVEAYQRYRPSYPRDILLLLQREYGLARASRVADIGCGTGLLARLFLDYGCEVFGVEPNPGMRASAEASLAAEPRFHSIDGRAESTTLPDRAFDFVTAGQAFHWFEPAAAHGELRRILRSGGWLVLVWNERRIEPGFQAGYDDIVREFAPETNRIREDAIGTVFGGHHWRLTEFPNQQLLDLAGLEGRVASCSYAPLPGAAGYLPMTEALAALFAEYQQDGQVTLLYDTKVYWGRIVTPAPGA